MNNVQCPDCGSTHCYRTNRRPSSDMYGMAHASHPLGFALSLASWAAKNILATHYLCSGCKAIFRKWLEKTA